MADEPSSNDQTNESGNQEQGPSVEEQIAAFQTNLDNSLGELRRSVGRAQSVADKAANQEPNAALQANLAETNGILADLVNGMDSDLIPAELRTKVMTAQAKIAEEALRDRITQEVMDQVQPAATSDQDAINVLATELTSRYERFGLNTSEINWDELNKVLPNGVEAGRAAADQMIADTLIANKTDDERQGRKDDSGKSPNEAAGTGGGNTNLAIMTTDSNELDKRHAALMALVR